MQLHTNNSLRPPKAFIAVFLVCLLMLASVQTSKASQQLGHIHMALAAYEEAPEALWSILYRNLDNYIAGATGPDIALISFPLEEFRGQSHPGEWPHYYNTGDFVMNMLDLAENPAEQAFAWGWFTHYIVDSTIHPLVNAYGGYYTDDILTAAKKARAKDRHIRLELFENRHVIETAGENPYFPHRYRVDHTAVPLELIKATYLRTYPGRTPEDLLPRLWTAALAMEVTTESFIAEAAGLRTRRRLSDVLSPIPAMFLETMPTAEEYQQLMNPLIIEDVQLYQHEEELFLKVTYTVNDLRLYKGFADDWDRTYFEAVRAIQEVFAIHETEPLQLELPNMDLDLGLPEGQTFDRSTVYPGNPEISSMLVTGSVTNDTGRELSPLRTSHFWVELDNLSETVWGGPAGTGTFLIPIDPAEPGPYHISLRLTLADPDTGVPFFDAGPQSEFEKTLGGEQHWSGQFTIYEYRPQYRDNVKTWQGEPGTSTSFSLFAQQTVNSMEVNRLVLEIGFFINRGILTLLPPPWTGDTSLQPLDLHQLGQEFVAIWENTMGHPPDEEAPPAWLRHAVDSAGQQHGDFRLEFVALGDMSTAAMMFEPREETLVFVGRVDLEGGTATGIVQGISGGTADIVGTWTAEQTKP